MKEWLLSIYLSYRGLDNREVLKQKQEELIFELTFYAILLKDHKAVLISIPNVNVGFKNLDYKEEIGKNGEDTYELY